MIKGRNKSSFVIHNAVDYKQLIKQKKKIADIRIGFVGRFSEEKQPHISRKWKGED